MWLGFLYFRVCTNSLGLLWVCVRQPQCFYSGVLLFIFGCIGVYTSQSVLCICRSIHEPLFMEGC